LIGWQLVQEPAIKPIHDCKQKAGRGQWMRLLLS